MWSFRLQYRASRDCVAEPEHESNCKGDGHLRVAGYGAVRSKVPTNITTPPALNVAE